MRVRPLFVLLSLLLATVSFCSADDSIFEVVGAGECADCKDKSFEASQAFSGLQVTIDCKLKNGGIKRIGSSELDKEGKFKVSLPKEIIEKGQKLKEECYAQLHSAASIPCPAHNGIEASKIVFQSSTNSKHVFGLTKPLQFSTPLCTSKFLWPYFKYPPLPKTHPWKKDFPKLHFPPIKDFGHPWYIPKPLPPPVPIYKPPIVKPLPPPVPIYKPPFVKPLPPPVPIYKPKPKPPVVIKPLPPPVPIYKPKPPVSLPPKKPCPPIKPKPPVYKPKPEPPVYKPKPKPKPPVYKPKPKPEPPVYKPKPKPPVYKPKPEPPVYKPKPKPPAYKPKPKPPVIIKPLPPPVPVYKPPVIVKPLPPPVPVYKPPVVVKPLPPPFYKKPCPPLPKLPPFPDFPPKSFPPLPPSLPKLPPFPNFPPMYFHHPKFGFFPPLPPSTTQP